MTIRRVPEDFVVEEMVEPTVLAGWSSARASGAEHAVFALRKTSLTTPDAIAKLAKALGIRAGTIDYAGLKDKHALTTQHVSVKADGKLAARLEKTGSEATSGTGWSARLVGWSKGPLTAEVIAANRFTIVVRDVSRGACEEMDRRMERLTAEGGADKELLPEKSNVEEGRRSSPSPPPSAAPLPAQPGRGGTSDDRDIRRAPEGRVEPRELVFINYFGDQRFGSARHGRGFIARHLIAGEFEEALRLAIATPARKDAPRVKRVRKLLAENWGQWSEVLGEMDQGAERRVVEILAKSGDYREAFAALPYFQQQIVVEAYQSHLWNAVARRLAEEMAGGRLVRTEDAFGEMVFPEPSAIGAAWRELSLPMLAAGTVLEGAWAKTADAVLREEGIGVEQLRIPGLRRPAFGEAMRPLVAAARRFEMSRAEADEMTPKRLKRTVRFELPRGSYATVVLRALGE